MLDEQQIILRYQRGETITSLAKSFNCTLNMFHIQGEDKSQINLGLIHGASLVAVMTFSKPNITKGGVNVNRDVWELNRFTTDAYVVVRGGAGKLFSYFAKNYKWSMIYSYADRRWSTGDLYMSLCFKHISNSQPNYWYLEPACKHRIYRFTFTKQRLVNQGFSSNLTERQIMTMRGFGRIWDCGTMRFEYHNPGYCC